MEDPIVVPEGNSWSIEMKTADANVDAGCVVTSNKILPMTSLKTTFACVSDGKSPESVYINKARGMDYSDVNKDETYIRFWVTNPASGSTFDIALNVWWGDA
ncbi:MAG: hypothetical protein V2I33_22020 [Kangiellaceae bacterium]|nr:hypothetical protein [Kangiellaceae bacterium]